MACWIATSGSWGVQLSLALPGLPPKLLTCAGHILLFMREMRYTRLSPVPKLTPAPIVYFDQHVFGHQVLWATASAGLLTGGGQREEVKAHRKGV
jgi:hypothetical protein